MCPLIPLSMSRSIERARHGVTSKKKGRPGYPGAHPTRAGWLDRAVIQATEISMTSTRPGYDVCDLCCRNPISWPGTGFCETCFQETADLAHQAEAEMYNRMSPAERAHYDAAHGSYDGCPED